MSLTRVIAYIGIGLGLFALIAFGLSGIGLGLRQTFAPAHEEVRYDTYKESRAKRDGTIQELSRLRMEYVSAESAAHKKAIAGTALQTYETYARPDNIPPDLREWIQDLKAKR